jgi:hypothetical protein
MGAFWIDHWTAGVLARRSRLQLCRHSGEGRKPRQAKGRSVCLSWMQGALVAFVGMTRWQDGRLLDRQLERGVLARRSRLRLCRHSGEGRKPRQAKGRSVCLSWMQGALVAFVGMTRWQDGRLLDRPLERGVLARRSRLRLCRHSGEGRKPRQAKGRSVCLPWMPTFVRAGTRAVQSRRHIPGARRKPRTRDPSSHGPGSLRVRGCGTDWSNLARNGARKAPQPLTSSASASA